MKGLIKCLECGSTFWARIYYEPDVNYWDIRDDDPMDGACEHIKSGGGYECIDTAYED